MSTARSSGSHGVFHIAIPRLPRGSDANPLAPRVDCIGLPSARHNQLSLLRSHPDLNRGIVVLQTTALPLGYGSEGPSYVPNVGPAINALGPLVADVVI